MGKVALWLGVGLVGSVGVLVGGLVVMDLMQDDPPATGIESWRIAADRFVEAINEGNEQAAQGLICRPTGDGDPPSAPERNVAELIHVEAEITRDNEVNPESPWSSPDYADVNYTATSTEGPIAPNSSIVLNDGGGRGWCVFNVYVFYQQ